MSEKKRDPWLSQQLEEVEPSRVQDPWLAQQLGSQQVSPQSFQPQRDPFITQQLAGDKFTDLPQRRQPLPLTFEPLPMAYIGERAKEFSPDELMPWVREVNPTAKLIELNAAAQRVHSGTATAQDRKIVSEWMAKETRPKSFGYQVLDLAIGIPGFAGELLLTGPATAVGKAVATQGLKQGLKELTKGFVKQSVKQGVKQSIKQQMIAQTGKKIASGLISGTIQTGLAGVPHMAAKTHQYMGPQLSTDGDGGIYIKKGDSLPKAAWKGVLGTWIDITSERSGGLLKELFQYLPPKVVNNVLTRALKKANPLMSNEKVKKIADLTKYHGIVGEMFEERVGELARGFPARQASKLLGYDDAFEEYKLPSWEQLAVEAVGFAIPGLTVLPFAYKNQQDRERVTKIKDELNILIEKHRFAKDVILPETEQVVPMGQLIESNIVSSTAQGEKSEVNVRNNFTADENSRAEGFAATLINGLGITQTNPDTGKQEPLAFNNLDFTMRNYLVNEALKRKDDPQEKQATDIVNLFQELRASPNIYVSGVDKKSEVGSKLDVPMGINPATKLFFSPFLKSMSLTDIAKHLVYSDIPLDQVNIHQTQVKNQLNLTPHIRLTLQTAYNKELLSRRNEFKDTRAELVKDVDQRLKPSLPAFQQANLQPKFDAAALSKFFEGKAPKAVLDVFKPEIKTEVTEAEAPSKEARFRDRIAKGKLPQFVKDFVEKSAIFVDQITADDPLLYSIKSDLRNAGIDEPAAAYFIQKEKLKPEDYATRDKLYAKVFKANRDKMSLVAASIDVKLEWAETRDEENQAKYLEYAWGKWVRQFNGGDSLHDLLFDYFLLDAGNDLLDADNEDPSIVPANPVAIAKIREVYDKNPAGGGLINRYKGILLNVLLQGRTGIPSKSGKGNWYLIPQDHDVQLDSPDVLLLEAASPSTWCTSFGHAADYIKMSDQAILIVNNKAVVGLEYYGQASLSAATSITNTQIGPVEYYEDTVAFLESNNIPYEDNPMMKKAAYYHKHGYTDYEEWEAVENEYFREIYRERADKQYNLYEELLKEWRAGKKIHIYGNDFEYFLIFKLEEERAKKAGASFDAKKMYLDHFFLSVLSRSPDYESPDYAEIYDKPIIHGLSINQLMGRVHTLVDYDIVAKDWEAGLAGNYWRERTDDPQGAGEINSRHERFDAMIQLYTDIFTNKEEAIVDIDDDRLVALNQERARRRAILETIVRAFNALELKDRMIAYAQTYGEELTTKEFFENFYKTRSFKFKRILDKYADLTSDELLFKGGAEQIKSEPEFLDYPGRFEVEVGREYLSKDTPPFKKVFFKKKKRGGQKNISLLMNLEKIREGRGRWGGVSQLAKAPEGILAAYDPINDKTLFSLSLLEEKDLEKKVLHEISHRGMYMLARKTGGFDKLYGMLDRARKELLTATPELLASTGHIDLESLAKDYGLDLQTREGDFFMLMELTARWSEKFSTQAPQAWYVRLLNEIALWFKEFCGVDFTRAEVDKLVSGFVYYGATAESQPSTLKDLQEFFRPKTALSEELQLGDPNRAPELKLDLKGNVVHGTVSDALKNYQLTLQDRTDAMTNKNFTYIVSKQIQELEKKLVPTDKKSQGLVARLSIAEAELNRVNARIKLLEEEKLEKNIKELFDLRRYRAKLTNTWNPNSPIRLKKQIESISKEIARLRKLSPAQTFRKGGDIYNIYEAELKGYLDQMTPQEKALVSGKNADKLGEIISEMEKHATADIVEQTDEMVDKRKELYNQWVADEPYLEPDRTVDLNDADIVAIDEYVSLAAEAKAAIDNSSSPELTKMGYEGRLREAWDRLSEDAKYSLTHESKGIEESVEDGTLEVGGDYSAVTAIVPFSLTGTSEGKPITITLTGTHKIQSVVEGELIAGIRADADYYRISNVDITPEQFKEMLQENHRRREVTGYAPLVIDYFGLQMAKRGTEAIDPKGAALAAKPNNPFKFKTPKLRLVLERMRWLADWFGDISDPNIMQEKLAAKPTVRLPQDVVAKLYKYAVKSTAWQKHAYNQMFEVDQVILGAIMKAHPEISVKEKKVIYDTVKKVLSSAMPEIYLKEGNSVQMSLTSVGRGGKHWTPEEGQAFLARVEYFIQLLQIDEAWMRQTYNIPSNVAVKDYLSQERPAMFFYKMLTHSNVAVDTELQRLLRWVGAEVMTPMLNRMMEIGVLDKADMAKNIDQGYMPRVFDLPPSQKKEASGGKGRTDPFSSTTYQAREFRTNEEYLEATGEWRTSWNPLDLPGWQKGKGQGLVVVDDFIAQMQRYIQDSLSRVSQLEVIKYVRDFEIAPGRKILYYVHEIEDLAKKEGVTAQNWLEKNFYIEANSAPGLVKFFKGGFQVPYVHRSFFDVITTMYEGERSRIAEGINNLQADLKRIQTVLPFDSNGLYLDAVILSGNLHVYKSFAKNILRLPGEALNIAVDLATNKYAEQPVPDRKHMALILKSGFSGFRFEDSLRAAFDIKELGKYELKRTQVENVKEFFLTFGGANTAIFNHVISQSLYDVIVAKFQSIKSRNPEMADEQAMYNAVSFVNDASNIPNRAVYGQLGKVWSFLQYARNLIFAPLRVAGGAAYGVTKLPGIKGTNREKALQEFFAYKTGKFTQALNPLLHGEKSVAELDALWKDYAWHFVKLQALWISVLWLIQYGIQSLIGGPDDDKDMFKNPPGFKLSLWLGNRDANNATYFLDPQFFRSTKLYYQMFGMLYPEEGKISYESPNPLKFVRNKSGPIVGALWSLVEYMMENGDVPPLTEGGKAGWLFDAATAGKELITPIGLDKQPELTTGKGLKALQFFGVGLRKNANVEPRLPVSLVKKVKQPAAMRDYIMRVARQRIAEGQDPVKVRRDLGLTAAQFLAIMKKEGLIDLFKRNRKAMIQFRKK